MPFRCCILVAGLTLATAAHAQLATAAHAQEVGRAEVDGRDVVLFENGAWRFADSEVVDGAECDGMVRINSPEVPLSYCLAETEWARESADGAFEAVYAHKQAELYLGVISERNTFTKEALREAIVSNARSAAGLGEVTVFDANLDVPIADEDWGYIKLGAEISGTDFIYWNYFLPTTGKAAQFVFWSTAEHEEDGDAISARVARTLRFAG